jgi:RNA 3'-terminal phosphate cyclase
VVITYYTKDNKVPGSSKEFRKDIKKLLNTAFGEDAKIEFTVKSQKVFCTKDDYGIGCLIFGENIVWDVGTVGEKVTEEAIVNRLKQLVNRKCCLDEHHQDQLLLYAALANGRTELLVG